MKIPEGYQEKVYAGWLGKIIGIRAGANIEGWTYEKIRDTYGELDGYPADFINFAADDDSNGPIFFLRALRDTAENYDLQPQDVATALLNYAAWERGFFWWGGYGISTEHTAYMNLRAGIPAPRSGSIEQNGSTMAEQIGGQIFIDTWGLVAPGNPDLAARYARAAASVTHDGNGIYGGIFIAVAVSWAFVENDLQKILDEALSYIPADCEYARVVQAMRKFHRENPGDWRAAFRYLQQNFGYDRYPGNCHIIPNAGVVILSLLYGEGDFDRTINICNMCGWDTDCNVANAGCIMGVRGGLQAISYEKWRAPINDLLICSSTVGSLNILDLPGCADYIASLAYDAAGEEPEPLWRELYSQFQRRCHFEYPGSTHAMRVRGAGSFSMENSAQRAFTGKRSLRICGQGTAQPAAIYRQTYYERKDFSDSRYNPSFSPILYPGQTVKAAVCAETEGVRACPYVRELHSGQVYSGEEVALVPGKWAELSYDIPAMEGALLGEAGILVESNDSWCVFLDDLTFEGAPDYTVEAACEREEWFAFGHTPVSQFTAMKGLACLQDGQLHLSCADFGEVYTGNWDWEDYTAEFAVTPVIGKEWGVNVRVQGAMRSYAVLFREQDVALMKNDCGYSAMQTRPFTWQPGQEYKIRVYACKNCLRVWIDGEEFFEWEDTEKPLRCGCVGMTVREGAHCALRQIRIRKQ